MKKLKTAVFGTGFMGRVHTEGIRRLGNVEVAAIAASSDDKARKFGDEVGVARTTGDYRTILSDPEIDAVHVCTPNALHFPMAKAAIEAGKHVLCEKPMSREPAEVERAFDVAERHGLVLSEAFMYRHNPQTKRLQELVEDGAIGELRVIRSAFSYSLLDTDNIRLRTDVEGGALMDVGCYCVSGSRLLGGEPDSVYGQQFIGPSGTDWVFAGMMRFPGDVIATFDCGTTLPNRDELEAIGTEGSLFLDDPWHCITPVIELRRDGGVELIEVERRDSYRLEFEDLGAAIRTGREPLLGRADAVAQATVIEALFRAAETGRPAKLA
jgi:predicted dehydrogenase